MQPIIGLYQLIKVVFKYVLIFYVLLFWLKNSTNIKFKCYGESESCSIVFTIKYWDVKNEKSTPIAVAKVSTHEKR